MESKRDLPKSTRVNSRGRTCYATGQLITVFVKLRDADNLSSLLARLTEGSRGKEKRGERVGKVRGKGQRM